MAQKILTAQELEAMTPAEQDAIFEASIIRNLDDAPREFLARVRQRFEGHLAAPRGYVFVAGRTFVSAYWTPPTLYDIHRTFQSISPPCCRLWNRLEASGRLRA